MFELEKVDKTIEAVCDRVQRKSKEGAFEDLELPNLVSALADLISARAETEVIKSIVCVTDNESRERDTDKMKKSCDYIGEKTKKEDHEMDKIRNNCHQSIIISLVAIVVSVAVLVANVIFG